MEPIRIEEILNWCEGKINRKNYLSQKISGVSTDTRTIKKGELYVAVKGNKFDGHDFVREAFLKKARAVLVSKDFDISDKPVIKVADTVKALGDIAEGYRSRFKTYIIAITGSDGKTTTKELLRETLSLKYKVKATMGNYNNQIGLPLSVFSLDCKTEFGVLEMGMNRKGEIACLSRIVKPDTGVITNVGRAHIGFLKSVREIAEAKAELLKNLCGEKFSLVNYDSGYSEIFKKSAPGKLKSFGLNEKSDIRGIVTEEGTDFFCFRTQGSKNVYKMNFWNPVMIYPALISLFLAKKFDIDTMQVKNLFSGITALQGRGKVHKNKELTVIDESYNSNPNSLRFALSAFKRKQNFKRKIAVLGDMAELGKFSGIFHRSIGKFLKNLSLDAVITFGDESSLISEISGSNSKHFKNINLLNEYLAQNMKSGDAILVKGSRVMGMERIISFLIQED
jgi:UDP-N-acetylmuramoyl-tripeptide--D-alanyl-D-alanine ligase